ncbi:MAG: ATP-dependent helicase HrpB [Gemmatimonadaceae bacterium]
MNALPIELILSDLRAALDSHRAVVLQAPPGAGKTTIVPTAFLGSPWLDDRSILMLEPRRLATRAAATRMASLRGERVGETIGYRMRGDSRVGPRTRVEVVTEGILTRRLQRDPTLDDVGLVIFDEFHERSLDADTGLALTLRTRSLLRDDLRIVVMSATLDGAAVSRMLGDAPVITSEGRLFPIDTRYVEPRAGARIESTVASTVASSLRNDTGDILVFLPGAAEIRRVEAGLATSDIGTAVVIPLFGALAHEEQDAALVPDPHGRRKIVLATSIAETSLTIEGIGVVIDAGLSRVPRFSPATGMTRLETIRVTIASAEQRRGRAGRLGPGVCYRLWPEYENSHLLAKPAPEIAAADLAGLALGLAAAGVSDPRELTWLDPPPAASFAGAVELLRELNGIDASGTITAHGAAMSELPLHPRLAHMLIRARALNASPLACDLAALLGDRDIFRGASGPIDADIALRLEFLRGSESRSLPFGAQLDRDGTRRVRAEADRLARQSGVAPRSATASIDHLGLLLALAYPDRVAQRRSGTRPRFLLRNGRGAELTGSQGLSPSQFLVAAELDDSRPESRIFLAAAIAEEDIRTAFADQIESEDVVEFDESTSSVRARRTERLGAIVLRDVAIGDPNPEAIRVALMRAIAARGIDSLPWPDAARRYRERMAFVAAHDSAWPDVSSTALAASAADWLAPALGDARKISDVAAIDLVAALGTLLDWRQRRDLDTLAPTHLDVPSGSRIAVDYSNAGAPVLAVRIQEVFGWTETPRLAGGRAALTLHLLSPAHRPVQVTQDLRGFWTSSYFDVRKDLRGRYPKHEWPEDPMTATPTRRAKPRRD